MSESGVGGSDDGKVASSAVRALSHHSSGSQRSFHSPSPGPRQLTENLFLRASVRATRPAPMDSGTSAWDITASPSSRVGFLVKRLDRKERGENEENDVDEEGGESRSLPVFASDRKKKERTADVEGEPS